MPPKAVNQKVVAGLAKKAEVAAKKQGVEDQKRAAAEEEEWKQGSNQRKQSKEQELAAKSDEAARKRREKEELLAAEEAALGSGGSKAKAAGVGGAAAKKKKAPKNDLALLEDALVSAADKKVKKKKELEQKKKEDEEKRIREAAEKKQKELAAMDPLLANTEQMLGSFMEGAADVRTANTKLLEEGNTASGIDAALESFNISGTPNGSGPAITSAKALYNDFEQRMMPIVKAENPGLRLSQYKEKIWNMWKKSPENPANQVPASG